MLLLVLTANALTPKDEADIRMAIKEYARLENQNGSVEIWSERPPHLYRIRRIEEVSGDVAMADAEDVREGWWVGPRPQYLFIFRRSGGRWTVVRKVRMYSGPPSGFQPVNGCVMCG